MKVTEMLCAAVEAVEFGKPLPEELAKHMQARYIGEVPVKCIRFTGGPVEFAVLLSQSPSTGSQFAILARRGYRLYWCMEYRSTELSCLACMGLKAPYHRCVDCRGTGKHFMFSYAPQGREQWLVVVKPGEEVAEVMDKETVRQLPVFSAP